MLEQILSQSGVFLLVAVRSLGLLFTLPLFSMRAVPRAARFALAFYMAYIMMGSADFSAYSLYTALDGTFSMYYFLLLVGEAMIGIIMGFYVSIIFAAFSTAGQFFAFQMGFSAASAYDALSQVENPLMGQFLNLVSMLIFMQSEWFQKLFIRGLMGSVSSLNCIELIQANEKLVAFLLRATSTSLTCRPASTSTALAEPQANSSCNRRSTSYKRKRLQQPEASFFFIPLSVYRILRLSAVARAPASRRA